MSENTVRESEEEREPEKGGFRFKYVFIIIIFLLLLLALLSHRAEDFSVLEGGSRQPLKNWIGPVGAQFSRIVLYLFGVASYPVMLLLILSTIRPLLPAPVNRRGYVGAMIAMALGITMLFAMVPEKFCFLTDYLGIGSRNASLSALSGGVIGQKLAAPAGSADPGLITGCIGTIGTLIVSLVFLFCGTFFVWLADWQPILNARRESKKEKEEELESIETLRAKRQQEMERRYKEYRQKREESIKSVKPEEPEPEEKEAVKPDPVIRKRPVKPARKISSSIEYVLPPITLLEKGVEIQGEHQEIIEASKKKLQATLDSFKIAGRVIGEISGPRVTRYEISLEPGVRVEKISSLANNIAMELEAKSIRVLAPIPGRNTVGVEVPNTDISLITLRSIMETPSWEKTNAELPIILGRNVAGDAIIMDLARAPHILIAGATGGGKSVCIHGLIMSLLFRFSPSDLKMILVDPKMVEFTRYYSLPHLITPVVKDSKKVPLVLRWGINEMERRYKIFSKLGSRNLNSFNSRPKGAVPVFDDDGNEVPDKFPFIIIIVDELAEIMMTDARKDVETSIARIAQKGRAAGIHLVIATQSPRVNVITGVIKANFSTRIALQVPAIVDSKVILDQKGAEKLLGKGDMLFIPPGSSNLERIQGALVYDAELEKVVGFAAEQIEQSFDDSIATGKFAGAQPDLGIEIAEEKEENLDGEESLIREAIEIVKNERKASTSFLQRRLGVGYNKAADIIDVLEKRGIVGPAVGASARREILVSGPEYGELSPNDDGEES